MKKLLCAFTALLMTFSLLGCSKKEEKGEFTVAKGKLKVAAEIGYPPFEYYDEDGVTPIGFDMELARIIADRLGLEVELIDVAWDGIFAGLDTDRYDLVMSAATITPERVENYYFSQPYIGNGQSIILRKDSTLEISSPADLEGLLVAYQAETTSDFFVEKQMAAGLQCNLAEYDKVMNAYDDLRLERVDAVVSDYLVAVSYLGVPDTQFKCVWQGTADEYFGVCMKKGNDTLRDKVNQVIDQLKADGTMKQLYIDIFGVDLSDTITN